MFLLVGQGHRARRSGALFLGCLDKQYRKLFSFVDEGEVTMKFESQMSQMGFPHHPIIQKCSAKIQKGFGNKLTVSSAEVDSDSPGVDIIAFTGWMHFTFSI